MFGYFPEFGGWFILELNELWNDPSRARRLFGYPVPVLLCVFGRSGNEITIADAAVDAAAQAADTTDKQAREDASVSLDVEPTTHKQEREQLQLVPFEPAEPISEVEEPDVPSISTQQLALVDPPDWSNWQLSRSLSSLKSTNRSDVIKTLRLLHVRFWHASANKMKTILMSANVDKSILDLIPSVVMTCKICRQWQRPDNRSMTNTRVSMDFNAVVQVDLLFVSNRIVLHAIDEATRWSMAVEIPDRQSGTIIHALTVCWFRVFGAPDLIVSDQEGGLCSEEASIWSERWGTQFRFKPKGSHASIVERHHAVLRDLIHKVGEECRRSLLDVPFTEIVAESVFAKNSLSYINGISPYMAVLGRQPRMLCDLESAGLSMLRDDSGPARHATRLREIAIATMVESTSQERIKRALHNHSRTNAEQLELQVNDLVDIFRTPANKDLSGWRGPCRVVNTTGVSEGYIDVKWGGRVMSVRTADVRRHILFAHIYAQMTSEPSPWNAILSHIRSIDKTSQLFGWVHGGNGTMLSNAARAYPQVYQALIRLGFEFPMLGRCTGGRLGIGVKSVAGLTDAEHSVLIWFYPNNVDELFMMTLHPNNPINFTRLFGNGWQLVYWIQLYGQSDNNGDTTTTTTPVPTTMSQSTIPEDAVFVPVPSSSISDNTMQSVRSSMSSSIPTLSSSSVSTKREPIKTDSSSTWTRSRTRGGHSSSSSSYDTVKPTEQQRPLPLSVSGTPLPLSTSSSSSWTRSRTRHGVSSVADSDITIRYPSTTGSQSTVQYPEDMSTYVPAHQIPVPTEHGVLTEETLPETVTYDTDEPEVTEVSDSVNTNFAELNYLVSLDDIENFCYNVQCGTCSPHVPAWWDNQDACNQVSADHHYYVDETSETTIGSYSTELQLELSSGLAQWLSDPIFIEKDEVLVFTVHNAQKITVGIEKTFDALSPTDIRIHWKLCEEAIRKELKSFADLDIFFPAERSKTANVMTSRWVLRWKSVDGKKTVKARLTARGFQDLSAETIETFAGTASRWGQRLISSVAIQHGWELFTWDVSTAFLQGVTFEELSSLTGEPIREVAMTPPTGTEKYFREIPGLENINFSTHVLGMKKAVYGLKDAPRAWRIKLDRTLRELGGHPLASDGALYVWHDTAGKLQLIISTHVDDKKGAGEEKVRQKVKQGLEKAFGKLKEQVKTFEHCGILHEQSDGKIIQHQNHYVKQLNTVNLSEYKGLEPGQLLTEKQKHLYSSILGGLSWLIQTRADIAIYVCALQRAAKAPTVEHMKRLNQVVRWIKRTPSALVYRKLNGQLKLLVISDSAFKREDKSGLAMRGALICIAEQKYADNPGGNLHIIEYYARKQRRVTRSTYAAELQALADAVEVGRLVNLAYTEIMIANVTATRLMQLENHGQLFIPMEAVIDAKSVFDSLRMPETKTPSEGSLIMVLLSLKEQMRSFLLRTLWWIHTEDMLADGLNKGIISRNAILHTANTGEWKLQKPAVKHFEKVQVVMK
jgi:hypothetical protein